MYYFLYQLPTPLIFIFLTCFGLIIGSFLNVVILRLPQQALSKNTAPYLLLFPRSHCLNCRTSLNFYDTIPILSFILLTGKCRFCQKTISWQYPLIEMLFTVITLILFIHFGFSLQFLLSILFSAILITLFMIDLKHYLLPDVLTLPLIWTGLLFNSQNLFTSAPSAILGAVVGYSSLWCFYWLHKKITHKEGLGHGDFKLFAAIGAWLGIMSLPFVLLLASILGVFIGLLWLMMMKKNRHAPIPFGPFLTFSSLLYLLYGPQISNGYLQLIMFN